jgi:hypothetical protein
VLKRLRKVRPKSRGLGLGISVVGASDPVREARIMVNHCVFGALPSVLNLQP